MSDASTVPPAWDDHGIVFVMTDQYDIPGAVIDSTATEVGEIPGGEEVFAENAPGPAPVTSMKKLTPAQSKRVAHGLIADLLAGSHSGVLKLRAASYGPENSALVLEAVQGMIVDHQNRSV